MSCERFKEMILDSILDECDPIKNTELQKHILTCEDCRLEYEQMQSATGIMKTKSGEELTPVEKLELENIIYRARLRQFTSRNARVVFLKRLTAAAASLFLFFLGFSIRSFYPGDSGIEELTVADQRIEEFLGRSLPDLSGQRMSSRGLFMMAKGARKALQEYESSRQLP